MGRCSALSCNLGYNNTCTCKFLMSLSLTLQLDCGLKPNNKIYAKTLWLTQQFSSIMYFQVEWFEQQKEKKYILLSDPLHHHQWYMVSFLFVDTLLYMLFNRNCALLFPLIILSFSFPSF